MADPVRFCVLRCPLKAHSDDEHFEMVASGDAAFIRMLRAMNRSACSSKCTKQVEDVTNRAVLARRDGEYVLVRLEEARG